MEAISKKRDAPSAPLEGTGNGADALIKRLCVLRGKLRDDVGAWEVVRDAIDALSRTPRTEVAGAVQEGWKLVPHIPTKEMIEAGCEQWHWIGTTTDAWQAMFCAAPDAPTED
ncbi:hypothetical protein NA66_1001740 [Burkholderia pyrrocinia]|uniref:Uncharacterized protein n=2 Tax=Burkholderiaceae TaxID=119060 RepID=A0A318J377_BURPY|nr:hypothetical protein NA66_1001740 [Burkholderia pyrrocinia]SFW58551.1 hypothetical protein SAMN03159384_03055 [Burkholderia sp. NFACC33-1]SFY12108.1 hypothetical protein SAMN03159408_03267 [Burkholderia sp. NFPP32]